MVVRQMVVGRLEDAEVVRPGVLRRVVVGVVAPVGLGDLESFAVRLEVPADRDLLGVLTVVVECRRGRDVSLGRR